jgi:hydrogenase maturation factor
MCVTRVGKTVEVTRGKATVEFFDGRTLDGVDVSMAKAGKGDYVEVFGNIALSVLDGSEARVRKKAWSEVRRGVKLAVAEGNRP